METRKLGNSDLELTVVGLGTWAIGGENPGYAWGPQKESDSIDAIHEALECGINWIDTAPVYGFGVSEEVVAKALKSWDKPVIVATKCGLCWNDSGIVPRLTRESVLKEIDDSRRRLDRDVIDLYQIHWPNPKAQFVEAWETLQDLKQKGVLRYAAVSNFSAEQLQKISELGEVTSLQPPYSMLERRIEDGALAWCRENHAGVIAYSPLQCGVLTDKFSREWVESLPDSDWRSDRMHYLQEPELTKVLAYVDSLRDIASSKGCSLAQLAISWVISQPGITAAIAGARRKGQIAETIQGTEITINSEDRKQLASVWDAFCLG